MSDLHNDEVLMEVEKRDRVIYVSYGEMVRHTMPLLSAETARESETHFAMQEGMSEVECFRLCPPPGGASTVPALDQHKGPERDLKDSL